MNLAAGTASSGFHGKVPWAGDFVRRRLADDLVQGWDDWLSARLPHLPVQAINPAVPARPWSLLCAPGLCGASGWAGVVAASVDRVGRRFPLLIARPVPADACAGGVLGDGLAWFAAAAALHVAVHAGAIDCNDGLDARVAALPLADADLTQPQGLHAATALRSRLAGWQRCLAEGGSLWWRDASGPPCLLPGLPDQAQCRRALEPADRGMETDA